MRIRSVTTAVVEANFDWTIVRIETDGGLVGWGESFFAPGLPRIAAELGELLIGQDPRDINRLIGRLYAAGSGAGSAGGMLLNAISGLDAALWDLTARALDTPLWRLLGGRFHDAVRVYADCHGSSALTSLGPLLQTRPSPWALDADDGSGRRTGITLFEPGAETEPLDLDRVTKNAAAAVHLGFDAVKFDVDVPGLIPTPEGSRRLPAASVELLGELIAAIKLGLGGAAEFALDCHWRYDLPTARTIAERCAGEGLLWLEDPLAVENGDGLRELARSTSVPLATGENLSRWAGFAPLIRDQAVAVVTPDLGKVGGLAEARLIAQTADVSGLSVAPHNIAGPVGTAFAAQVSATFPNLLALEYHAMSVPFFDDLIGGPLIVGGRIAMSDRPGIGVDVDEAAVRRHAKPGEPVFGASAPR
ncbi:mandelate racemase/muconate lactonizing enzyme family protein [Jiangella asiatica]|uniref:mandelate racemase/muconate lactonizing enzyme family protein n=1 Tax=Jiangella asiatica TaxID=2530372 RepID=UPI0013A5D29B|nr:mandelate racemase/muconate lactonizing enzyme family protein [Jiangella asiatica]